MKTKILIFLAMLFMANGSVYAEEGFSVAKTIIRACEGSAREFAWRAGRDRGGLEVEDVLPYYYKLARQNLMENGYSPILSRVDKRDVRVIAEYMFESSNPTITDYKINCLLGKVSPKWYAGFVKKNGVPKEVFLAVEKLTEKVVSKK